VQLKKKISFFFLDKNGIKKLSKKLISKKKF